MTPGWWPAFTLWILVFLVPLGLVRAMILGHMEQESSMARLSQERDLRHELDRFRRDVKMGSFLPDVLGTRLPKEMMMTWQTCRLLRGLSDPFSRAGMKGLLAGIRRAAGFSPHYVILYDGPRDRLAGWCDAHVRARLIRPGLRLAVRNWLRVYAEDRLAVLPTEKELPSLFFQSFFRSSLGVIAGPAKTPFELQEIFSATVGDRLMHLSIPLRNPDSGVAEGLLLIGFFDRNIRLPTVLRRAAQKVSPHGFRRFFLRKPGLMMPRWVRTTRGTTVIHPLQGRMALLGKAAPKRGAWCLGVRSSMPESPAARFPGYLNRAFRMEGVLQSTAWLALLSGFGMVYVLLRGTGVIVSLRAKIAVTFLLGTLVPVLGPAWLGVAFLSASRQAEAENVLERMVTRLEQLDREYSGCESSAAARSEAFRHLLTSLVARGLPAAEMQRRMTDLCRKYRISSAFLMLADGSEVAAFDHKGEEMVRRVLFLFRGTFLETLIGRGISAAAGVSAGRRQQLQTSADVMLSMVEGHVDVRMFGSFLRQPGIALQTDLSVIFERFALIFPGKPGQIPSGVGLLHFTMHNFSEPLYSRLMAHPERLQERVGAFDVAFHLYPLDSRTGTVLRDHWPGWRRPLPEQMAKLLPFAQGVMSHRISTRQNNLEAGHPHLLAGRFMADQGILAVALAEPRSLAGWWESGMALPASLAVYGVFVAFLMAYVTTFSLLRPFPPILEAIKATAAGRFDWQLDLAQTDEFGDLAESFNRMAVSLQEKTHLRRFVSQEVLDAVSHDDDSYLKPGGERMTVTVLFSDIRGFTTLSERHPPERIVRLLNRYFTEMEREILRFHGSLDKFIGDAILAVFRDRPDLPAAVDRAVDAALAMRHSLAALNAAWEGEGEVSLENGIGLATGTVISGRIGSVQGRLDFTVVGAPVQVAAQLEAASKFGRASRIMIDETTRSSLARKGCCLPVPMPSEEEESISVSPMWELENPRE
jgi:class 3 adenylate cyclase